MENLPKIPYYYVDHLIAEGGTAKVYWGIDLRSGYAVAIKELKIRHFKNATIRKKFIDEAQMYLYMQHPNICKLVDFIDLKESGQLFIIMEFIEGRNMEQYIYTEIGLIPVQKALPMFLEILSAVSYLHKKKVLHLDIKSNNVMILPNGKLKIIDLGIASRMTGASISNSIGFGTPAYMPPEQAEMRKVGPYSDIFALGVMLFEMLTGHLPFTSNNPNPRQNVDEIRSKVKSAPVPQMSQFYPPLNKKIQAIVEKAMEKEPSKRYQSCEEFADAIKLYMQEMNH